MLRSVPVCFAAFLLSTHPPPAFYLNISLLIFPQWIFLSARKIAANLQNNRLCSLLFLTPNCGTQECLCTEFSFSHVLKRNFIKKNKSQLLQILKLLTLAMLSLACRLVPQLPRTCDMPQKIAGGSGQEKWKWNRLGGWGWMWNLVF